MICNKVPSDSRKVDDERGWEVGIREDAEEGCWERSEGMLRKLTIWALQVDEAALGARLYETLLPDSVADVMRSEVITREKR